LAKQNSGFTSSAYEVVRKTRCTNKQTRIAAAFIPALVQLEISHIS